MGAVLAGLHGRCRLRRAAAYQPKYVPTIGQSTDATDQPDDQGAVSLIPAHPEAQDLPGDLTAAAVPVTVRPLDDAAARRLRRPRGA